MDIQFLKPDRRFVSLFASLPVAVLALAGTLSAQQTLTLDEAVARSLRVHPSMAQSQAGLENAGVSHRAAWGSFLPSLSLSSGASTNSSQRFDAATQRTVTGASQSYNAGVSLSYSVFNGGQRFADMDRARADIASAEADLENQRFAVVLQTKDLYFGALRQADLLEVARASVERAEESLANTRRRTELGSGTRSDTLRARLEVTNAMQSVLQAEAATRAARFALGRQVGLPEPVVPELPEGLEPSPLPISEQEIVVIAEELSPAVRSARAAARAASAAAGSSRSSRFPSLRLSSGYSWANSQAALDGGRASWNVRLSGSYNVFDGFNRDQSIARAENQERVAFVQEEDARRGVRAQVDGALFALRTSEQAIALAIQAREVAEEDLRVVQQRYDLSAATILDLITSQIALVEAESGLVTARYDYMVARAELEAILGREL